MADKSKGYVLLYRSICDDPLWKYKPFDPARAWIDIFLNANHADGKVFTGSDYVEVKRGQKWTSLEKLAKRWGWSKGKVLRYLNALKRDGKITKDGTSNGTLITVVNYEDLQSRWNAKRNADGTLMEPQTERRRVTNKEEKKEEKKELERSADALVPSEPYKEPDPAEGWGFD